MASEITAQNIDTRIGEAAQAQVSTSDYGAVGDQRPYQIVQPAYPAPQWLARFSNLNNALRECGTLCQLTGKPFKLVKWGARVPCYPCSSKKHRGSLPSLRIHSPGALAGFADAQPIADFAPNQTVVYDGNGQPKVVGAQSFVVSSRPTVAASTFIDPQPLTQRYAQAVQSAMYLANTTGKPAYVCSSLGADCKGGAAKGYVPVVYVQPGGLVKRYSQSLPLTNSAKGSQVATTAVSEDDFRELIRESEGRSRLGWGA